MLPTAIIAKTRDSEELSGDEIRFMINGLVDGTIPDYQIASWAMAVLCRGMTSAETSILTECMLSSGDFLPRVSERPRVDKHSTGGLGDKTSLILAPLLSCFDIEVPMLSGRGLGITGGTLDKLEAYRGFRCDLTAAEVSKQLNAIGCVITGTTPNITPADRKLYSLRDVTGTVPSIPLITASILSKKLAETLDALVLDVKFGSGAFMRNLPDAKNLAQSLLATSAQMGLTTTAIISDMNQPLGNMVGNACEANESVEVLRGHGPSDVRELTLRLSAELLVNVGHASDIPAAIKMLEAALDNGNAFEKYVQMIEHQNGHFEESLPLAQRFTISSQQSGWIAAINGQDLGHAIISLGGGRRRLGEQLNHAVGLQVLCRVGDPISKGDALLHIFAANQSDFEMVQGPLLNAFKLSATFVNPLSLTVS